MPTLNNDAMSELMSVSPQPQQELQEPQTYSQEAPAVSPASPATSFTMSWQELEAQLPRMVASSWPGVIVRRLKDMVKFTLKHEMGDAQILAYIGPGNLPDATLNFNPPWVDKYFDDSPQRLLQWVQFQTQLLAEYLRTGRRDAKLALEEPRPPGRPGRKPGSAWHGPNGLFAGHNVNASSGEQLNGSPSELPAWQLQHQNGSIDGAQPSFVQPQPHLPTYDGIDIVLTQDTSANPSYLGQYYMKATSRKGEARLQIERELGYPSTYTASELRHALFFYESRGLRVRVEPPFPRLD